MIEADLGHTYYLDILDYPGSAMQTLRFVKRIGEKYPGNTGFPYAGVIIQEVLRACIARVKYVDNQIHSDYNVKVLYDLRHALLQLELRAVQRHETTLQLVELDTIEFEEVGKNGHILKGAGHE